MIVHDLDRVDSRFRSELLWVRHEVDGHGMYYRQFGLRDMAGFLELLTLGPDLEQENQDVAERAKKALVFTTRSAPNDCWSPSRFEC